MDLEYLVGRKLQIHLLNSYYHVYDNFLHRQGTLDRLGKYLQTYQQKKCEDAIKNLFGAMAPTYLQLPLWQWIAGNVYLLVLSKTKK